MKILTRKQFMKMPVGTVFSYYEPCCFRGLYIKDSSYEEGYPDFCMTDVIGAIDSDSSGDYFYRCELMEQGKSVDVDFESSGREGLFDDDLLYAVYEKNDMQKLIERLKATLSLE